jgi:putative PEP-CTERM system TPR-repeat lipoprotein
MSASTRAAAAPAFALLAVVALLGCAGKPTPEKAVANAQQLIAAGKPGEARVHMKALLAEHPENLEARLLLARIALDNGDLRVADEELSQLTPEQLRDPRAETLRLWVDLGVGKHAAILAAIGQGKVNTEGAERARIRAAALRAAGSPADALEVLRSAAAASPQDAAVAVDLAETLAAIGNLQQARVELDAFLEKNPRQPDALAARGSLHLRGGATAKAVEDLSAALSAATPAWGVLKRVNTQVLLGEAALAAGNVPLAREQLAAIEKDHPGALGANLLAADIALYEGRAGDAADALQVVARAMPGNARVQYLLADAWVRGGNTTRAIDLLERRVREVPADATARRMLARLLRNTRPDRVVELLGDLPQEDLDSSGEADNLLSAARLAQSQANAALEEVQAKLAKQPDDRDLKLELAFAYLRNGQPTRALSTLKELNATLTSPPAASLEMRAYFAAGNEREANRLVATLIESRQASVDVLLGAADASSAAGRGDGAKRLVAEALRREPDNASALLRQANLQFLDREYPAAEKTLQTLAAKKPDDVRSRAALARVAEARGDHAAARAALEEAVKLSPGKPEPALMLAGLLLRNGQTADAAKVFDQLVAAGNDNGAAANAAGQMMLRAGRAAEARDWFGKAVQQAPEEAGYWFNLGRAQVNAEDRQAAIQSFERAVALRPEWVEANTAAIQLNVEARQLARARQLTQAFAAKLPAEPMAWMMKGKVAYAEGNAPEAIAAFARSYSLRPSAAAAVREYWAREQSRAPRPAQPLLNWLTQEPSDADVRRMLAQYYQRTGATRELVAQLDKILELAPNDAVSMNNLAWALLETDAARAEQLARRAHAISPQQPAFADTLGSALIAGGKYAEAARVLGVAVQGLPQDASVRTRYALALARSGDAAGARRELQVALGAGNAFDERATAEKLLRELGT